MKYKYLVVVYMLLVGVLVSVLIAAGQPLGAFVAMLLSVYVLASALFG